MTIGKVIRYIREEQGLSQEAFGALFGRGQRDISFFESDRAVPGKEFLNAVAARFDDDILAAIICGERDRDWLRTAVRHSIRTGEIVYA